MVDVVDLSASVAQVENNAHGFKNVIVREDHRAFNFVTTDTTVELHAPYARQIVSVFVEEEALEQRLYGFGRRRLAGAHHAIDRYTCGSLVGNVIRLERHGNPRALVQFVDVQRTDMVNAAFDQFFERLFG